MTTLSKDDKAQIIASHKRNLEYRQYGLELDVMAENAKVSPNAEIISGFQASIDEIDDQLAALDAELTSVNALTE